ncbi:hypothetical protein CALVIDRAFT_541756 [Calocera viscosa TUFC12733]|uniref:Uncharacterized protein n=1 Tax=Calocera viscosa (strain TUFC12733) TaxID=1330018 RepID=A0A167HGB5_CALVF|nr:hypothetical protein CALVIDRAFT_541756 [Calocera viscosa TUFC12733]
MDPNQQRQQQQQQHQFTLPPGFNLQAANALGRAPPQQAQQPPHLPTQQLSNPIPSIRGGVQRHGTQEVWSALQRMVEMSNNMGQPNPEMLSQMSQLLSNNGIQTQGFPQQAQQMQQFQNGNNPQFQQAMGQQMQQPFPGMPNMPQGMPNNMNGNLQQGSMQQQQQQQQQNIAQMFQLGMGPQQGQGQGQQQQQQQIPPQFMQAAQMQQNGFQMPMQQQMQQPQQSQGQQQQGQPADPHMAELLSEQQQQNGGLQQQILKSLTAADLQALKEMNPAQRASHIALRFANQGLPPQGAPSTSQQQQAPPPGLPQQMRQPTPMNNQFQQFMTPQQANRVMQQQQQSQQQPQQPVAQRQAMPQQAQLQNQQMNEERLRQQQRNHALAAAMNPNSNMDPTMRMRLLAKFGQPQVQQPPQQQPQQMHPAPPPPAQAQSMQPAQPPQQQPQQQTQQQQQQQAMMHMLNQPRSGIPMASVSMKPQQPPTIAGPMPGPPGSEPGPSAETVQFVQSMQDVPLPRLSAQLQKEHQEVQVLVRQFQQLQQLPPEQQQSPQAVNLKNTLLARQRRIQLITRIIKSKQEQQRQAAGISTNPAGLGDQNPGAPGMPMGNNGLVPPGMAQAASQSPNQMRTGPSPPVPQQQMGQPQPMAQMNQPGPTAAQQQQHAFMIRNQQPAPPNAGGRSQRLPPGAISNDMNGNPTFQPQSNMPMAINVPPPQQQPPPPPPSQQQMMNVINAQPKQQMPPQPPQVAQPAPPQMLPMQSQQQAPDMQHLQAPAPGLPQQQQGSASGQTMMQGGQRNAEVNDLLHYMANAKSLTDLQVQHMGVLMPLWTEKEKFVPMARALRDNLQRPCPKPEFQDRWLRFAQSNLGMLQKTFQFAGPESLKIEGSDVNIYDYYSVLVGVRALGKQIVNSLEFYANAGIRVGVPPQPGQQRCSLTAASLLKAFSEVALVPIHTQFLDDHEQAFLYARMLPSFYVGHQWRPDVPPPPGPADNVPANAVPSRPNQPGGQPAGVPQAEQDEYYLMIMTSQDETLLKMGYPEDQIRRAREELQRMPQEGKANIRKRMHERGRQQQLQQRMMGQQGQIQPGAVNMQMLQAGQAQGLQNPPFSQSQVGVRPLAQSSPPNMTLASLQQGMNQFPVQPPSGGAPSGAAPPPQVRVPISDPAQAMAYVNNLVTDAKRQFPPQPRPMQMPSEMEQKYWQLVGLAREIASNVRHRLYRFVTTAQATAHNGNVLSAAPRYLMLVEEQVAGRGKQPPQYYLDFQQLLETIKRMYLLDRYICINALGMPPGPSPIRSPYWPSSQWLIVHGMDRQSRIVTPNEPDPEKEPPPNVPPQAPTPSSQAAIARRGAKRSLGPDEGSAQPPSKRGRASGVAVNPTPSPAMVVPTPGPASTPHMDASQTPANAPTVSDTTRTPKSPEVSKGKGKATKPRAPPKRKPTKSGIPSTAEVIVIDQTPKLQERGVKRPRDSDVIVLDGAGEDEPAGKRTKVDNAEEKQPASVVVAPAAAELPVPTQPAFSLFLSTTKAEDISFQQALAEFNELRDVVRQGEEESAKPGEGPGTGDGGNGTVDQPSDSIFPGLDLESEVMEWVDWDFGDPDEPTPELEKVAQSSPETTDSNKKPPVQGADGATVTAAMSDAQPPVDAQNVKWDWEKPVPSGRWAISDTPIIY